jgi:hypothetical protein
MYLTNLCPYFSEQNIKFDINITGQPPVVLSAHKEGATEVGISNIAEVSQIPYSDLENIKKFINSICWLCSFASGRLSAVARMEVLRNEELIYQELTSVDTTLNQGPKVIYDVDDLTQFIERSYNYYQQIATTYNLNNLINLGILAKHTPYIEVKTLLMCNFLEVLRYNYALNVGCSKGVFIQDDINFNLAIGSKTGRRASFQDILQNFCEENKLTGWSSDFKNIRNEIVHNGNITGSNFIEKRQKYKDLHHFCDKVILALLKWDLVLGHYIPINCSTDLNLKEILGEVIAGEVGQVIVGVNGVKFTK